MSRKYIIFSLLTKWLFPRMKGLRGPGRNGFAGPDGMASRARMRRNLEDPGLSHTQKYMSTSGYPHHHLNLHRQVLPACISLRFSLTVWVRFLRAPVLKNGNVRLENTRDNLPIAQESRSVRLWHVTVTSTLRNKSTNTSSGATRYLFICRIKS